MTDPAATCDTSVPVAALVAWHPRHDDARGVLRARVSALPTHVLLETYSVLTRLPPPHRLSVAVAREAVVGLGCPGVQLPAAECTRLVDTLAAHDVRGRCG